MHLFFAENVDADLVVLSAEEAAHAARVLRLRVGDEVMVTDGRGAMAWGEVETVERDSVAIAIAKLAVNHEKRHYKIWLAVAPTKNIDRIEWLLEKATEIGVDRITPIICEHSERKVFRTDRAMKIITAAVKQSQKAYLPQLDEPMRFDDFLREAQDAEGQRFIAHCDEDGAKRELALTLTAGGSYVVGIGPEGDFSPEEVVSAHAAGFASVGLGPARLRTETAALYAVTLAAQKNISY